RPVALLRPRHERRIVSLGRGQPHDPPGVPPARAGRCRQAGRGRPRGRPGPARAAAQPPALAGLRAQARLRQLAHPGGRRRVAGRPHGAAWPRPQPRCRAAAGRAGQRRPPARGRAGGPYRRQAVWGAQQVADPRSRGPWRRRGPYPPRHRRRTRPNSTPPVLYFVNNGHDPFVSPTGGRLMPLVLSVVRLRHGDPLAERTWRDTHFAHAKVLEWAADGHRVLWARPHPDLMLIQSTKPVDTDALPSGLHVTHKPVDTDWPAGAKIRWS